MRVFYLNLAFTQNKKKNGDLYINLEKIRGQIVLHNILVKKALFVLQSWRAFVQRCLYIETIHTTTTKRLRGGGEHTSYMRYYTLIHRLSGPERERERERDEQ
jgi:hypothetical protein